MHRVVQKNQLKYKTFRTANKPPEFKSQQLELGLCPHAILNRARLSDGKAFGVSAYLSI